MAPTAEASIAARFATPLLAALLALHQRGIAHRDIKLDNLALAASGEGDGGGDASSLRVLDFGLALDMGAEGVDAAVASQVGTLHYMAPELFGAPLSAWSHA